MDEDFCNNETKAMTGTQRAKAAYILIVCFSQALLLLSDYLNEPDKRLKPPKLLFLSILFKSEVLPHRRPAKQYFYLWATEQLQSLWTSSVMESRPEAMLDILHQYVSTPREQVVADMSLR